MLDIKDHLIVKDNFFKKKILYKIYRELLNCNFNNRFNTIKNTVYQKIYFNFNLNNDHFAVKEILKQLKKEYELDLVSLGHSYFLSTKHEEATPHKDVSSDVNCLVYLKGKKQLNSGTGFYDYDKKINRYDLNRHIGFKENRAIIFDSSIFHASLQFNEGAGSRYVMANFFNYKDKK